MSQLHEIILQLHLFFLNILTVSGYTLYSILQVNSISV